MDTDLRRYLDQMKEKNGLEKYFLDFEANAIELYFNWDLRTSKLDIELVINYLLRNGYEVEKVYLNEHSEILKMPPKGYSFDFGLYLADESRCNAIIFIKSF